MLRSTLLLYSLIFLLIIFIFILIVINTLPYHCGPENPKNLIILKPHLKALRDEFGGQNIELELFRLTHIISNFFKFDLKL